jgi:hypothetical protein
MTELCGACYRKTKLRSVVETGKGCSLVERTLEQSSEGQMELLEGPTPSEAAACTEADISEVIQRNTSTSSVGQQGRV